MGHTGSLCSKGNGKTLGEGVTEVQTRCGFSKTPLSSVEKQLQRSQSGSCQSNQEATANVAVRGAGLIRDVMRRRDVEGLGMCLRDEVTRIADSHTYLYRKNVLNGLEDYTLNR